MFFADKSDEIARATTQMNVGSYSPISYVEVLTPKSELSFRIAHQMSAPDIVIYTACVLECAEGIEALRVANSGDIAFSYRYDAQGGERLFLKDRGYHDWLESLSTFGPSDVFGDAKPVLETDISDFYQRIYWHRIENVLNDSGASKDCFNALKKILQVGRAKQSFGIPVGSSASRLLAEGLLCDTDRMLRDLGVEATRFVDDFRIIPGGSHNTHTVLCRLAEHLMITEGLSLNSSKTKITDSKQLHASANERLEDVFSVTELQKLRHWLTLIYGSEEANETEEEPVLSGDDLLDRLDELKKRSSSDFSARKAVLKILRSGEFDVERFTKEHSDLAYYLPRDFSLALKAATGRAGTDIPKLGQTVWRILNLAPISELPFARLWLLNLYANGSLAPTIEAANLAGQSNNVLEQRQGVFIRAQLNDRPYFREQKSRLGQASEWLKPAVLIGARCLPAEEYRTWVDVAVRQISHPFASIFGTWLKSDFDLKKVLAV